MNAFIERVHINVKGQKMPRRPMSEQEFEHTKSLILKEAAAIVGQSSLAELSMRALAGRVGLTPGALYRYFPSKKEMLHAYWDSALKELSERIVAISSNENDPVIAIRKMFAAYTDFCLEDPDRFKVFFLESDQSFDEGYAQPDSFIPYEHLVMRVTEAVDKAIFETDDPILIAQALWSAAHGAVTLLITETDLPLSQPQKLLSKILDTMMRGLSAQEQ